MVLTDKIIKSKEMNIMERLEEVLEEIKKFVKDRNWDQFHEPANLAKSIVIESAELLECFQWSNDKYDIEAVKEELADLIIYCLQMTIGLKLDPIEIIKAKMEKNAKKYPVEKCNGISTKYDKLQ